jgi:hypothetical protein
MTDPMIIIAIACSVYFGLLFFGWLTLLLLSRKGSGYKDEFGLGLVGVGVAGFVALIILLGSFFPDQPDVVYVESQHYEQEKP